MEHIPIFGLCLLRETKHKREGLTLSGSIVARDEAFPGSWAEWGQPEPRPLVSLALKVSEKALRTALKDQ